MQNIEKRDNPIERGHHWTFSLGGQFSNGIILWQDHEETTDVPLSWDFGIFHSGEWQALMHPAVSHHNFTWCGVSCIDCHVSPMLLRWRPRDGSTLHPLLHACATFVTRSPSTRCTMTEWKPPVGCQHEDCKVCVATVVVIVLGQWFVDEPAFFRTVASAYDVWTAGISESSWCFASQIFGVSFENLLRWPWERLCWWTFHSRNKICYRCADITGSRLT